MYLDSNLLIPQPIIILVVIAPHMKIAKEDKFQLQLNPPNLEEMRNTRIDSYKRQIKFLNQVLAGRFLYNSTAISPRHKFKERSHRKQARVDSNVAGLRNACKRPKSDREIFRIDRSTDEADVNEDPYFLSDSVNFLEVKKK